VFAKKLLAKTANSEKKWIIRNKEKKYKYLLCFFHFCPNNKNKQTIKNQNFTLKQQHY